MRNILLLISSSLGAHSPQATRLLPHRPIGSARRVAGRRAGLGSEVRRPVAVAHLQGRHGIGQFSLLKFIFSLLFYGLSPTRKSHN